MSLPPERVQIKRKKEDDPVEALYFATQEAQRSANKRQLTNEGFIFRRQKTDDGIAFSRPPGLASPPSGKVVKPDGVPTIRTTQPGEEDLEYGGGNSSDHSSAKGSSQRIMQPLPIRSRELPDSRTPFTAIHRPEQPMRSSSIASTPAISSTSLQPRRFHLSKSSPTTPFPQSPVSGVHKRKKGALKNEVAVFVEKEKRKLKKPKSLLNLVSAAGKLKLEDDTQPAKVSEAAPIKAPRRRPKVSAIEKKLAAEHKAAWAASHKQDATKPRGSAETIQANPEDWDLSSEKLAAELDAFVRQTLNPTFDPTAPSPSIPLKYKPRPPAHRIGSRDTPQQPPVNTEDTRMDSSSETDEEDYVIDTYIREPLPGGDSANAVSLPKPGEVGYLVIEPEDEQRWLAYADKEESENEYDTDDQDSNAEDYYGNDYPEEEVDSDDERGKGAYVKYRTGNASDEESFDEARAWSDDEAEDHQLRGDGDDFEDADGDGEGDWDWILQSGVGKSRPGRTGAGVEGAMTLRDEDEDMVLD